MKVRFAVTPGGGLGSAGDLEGLVDALERSAFDGIWLSDVPLTPLVDPLIGLSYAAARSSRLKLGANVVPLGRNPYLLAKELAQIDVVSGGRLLLAFVPGLDQVGERGALGVAGSDRHVVLEEVLELVRQWWAGETVTRASSGWVFDDLASVARPVQDPLEIWLGGHGPRALERAGRISDGWLGAAVTPKEAEAARTTIEQAASQSGRRIDPEHFGMSIAYARSDGDRSLLSGLRARREDVDPKDIVPVGAESLRSMILAYMDCGLSKFVLRPGRIEVGWDEELEWLADAVIDLQT